MTSDSSAGIRLVSDQAGNASTAMHAYADALPSRAAVAQVHGDDREPVSAAFLARLRTAADHLGAATDELARYVHDNADALRRAAQHLADTDAQSRAAAVALIERIAAAAPAAAPTHSAAGAGTDAADGRSVSNLAAPGRSH